MEMTNGNGFLWIFLYIHISKHLLKPFQGGYNFEGFIGNNFSVSISLLSAQSCRQKYDIL